LFQFQISRRLRQFGQELLHLRQSNRHADPVLKDNGRLEVARSNKDHSHVLRQNTGHSDNVTEIKISPARFYRGGNQDQNAVQQIVCDDEIVFKTSSNQKLPLWYV